jgi:hypothetical protein
VKYVNFSVNEMSGEKQGVVGEGSSHRNHSGANPGK